MYMKKHVLVALVATLLLMNGCRTMQPLVVTNTQTETQEQVQRDIVCEENILETKMIIREETKKTDEVTTETTVTTKYDTSQPIDPATGRPPVSEQTTTVKTTGKTEDYANKKNSQTQMETTAAITDKSHSDTAVKTTVHTAQEQPEDPYRYRYIFYIIITVLIAGVAVFLLLKKYHIFPIIVSLFKKLFGGFS
jgi:uncharacterized membrane protein